MIELYESNPHKITTAQEKAQCVSWFIETKSDVQTSETTEVSMEETTITSFNSFMAQEIYGDRDSVCSMQGEEWATKNI